MRVLILGGAGMLGHKLIQRWQGELEIAATIRTTAAKSPLRALGLDVPLYEGVTAEKLSTVEGAIADFRPNAVVNCIGIVKQLKEAKDPALSIRLNALFPHLAAKVCEQHGARLIHISTDCVFSGAGGPYSEDDVADANDLYGRTKRLGEVETAGSCTLRTSIIGRQLNRGTGLLEWFLQHPGPAIGGYRHALYTGITTLAFADILRRIIVVDGQLEGLWHVSSDAISKFELLNIVSDVYDKQIRIEEDVDFHCDRRLDSSRFRTQTGFAPQPWREMIEAMHADSANYGDLTRGVN